MDGNSFTPRELENYTNAPEWVKQHLWSFMYPERTRAIQAHLAKQQQKAPVAPVNTNDDFMSKFNAPGELSSQVVTPVNTQIPIKEVDNYLSDANLWRGLGVYTTEAPSIPKNEIVDDYFNYKPKISERSVQPIPATAKPAPTKPKPAVKKSTSSKPTAVAIPQYVASPVEQSQKALAAAQDANLGGMTNTPTITAPVAAVDPMGNMEAIRKQQRDARNLITQGDLANYFNQQQAIQNQISSKNNNLTAQQYWELMG